MMILGMFIGGVLVVAGVVLGAVIVYRCRGGEGPLLTGRKDVAIEQDFADDTEE